MFNFSSDSDLNAYRTLQGMINKNQGLWFSGKQAQFLTSEKSPLLAYPFSDSHDISFVNSNFGLNLTEEPLRLVMVYASAGSGRWGSPITWGFVLDQFGVTTKYRLRYTKTSVGGFAPNANRTEVEFKRDPSTDTSALEEFYARKAEEEASKPEPTEFKSEFVAIPGARTKNTYTVVKSIPRDGFYGSYFMNILRDTDGNLCFINSNRVCIEEEFGTDPVVIRATVKGHFVTKQGEKATSFDRPFSPN